MIGLQASSTVHFLFLLSELKEMKRCLWMVAQRLVLLAGALLSSFLLFEELLERPRASRHHPFSFIKRKKKATNGWPRFFSSLRSTVTFFFFLKREIKTASCQHFLYEREKRENERFIKKHLLVLFSFFFFHKMGNVGHKDRWAPSSFFIIRGSPS